MTVGNSFTGASALRRVALLAAAALLLALFPAGAASADDAEVSDAADNESGTIQIDDGSDGLVPAIRYAGEVRSDTARLIADDETAFAAAYEAGVLIVARGDLFPDALAGSYAGGQEAAPILLTNSDMINPNFQASLDHWSGGDPTTIDVIILGGTAAISQDVQDDLEAAGHDVTRLSGPTRIDTAVDIATAYDEMTIGVIDGMRTAIVASAGNFPDALVGGALSAGLLFPMLLTWPDTLPDETADALTDLGIEKVLLAGGSAAVSDVVEAQLDALGLDVERIGGENRFHTARLFAETATANLGFTDDHVNLATGGDFPDALALGPHAGLDYAGPSPILLGGDTLPTHTTEYFQSIADCGFDSLHIAGGTAAVSNDQKAEAREALTTDDDCPALAAALTGANEIPPADLDGAGTALVVADVTANEVCVDLSVTGIDLTGDPAEAAHIHAGDATTNGPVVITLPTPNTEGFASGCVGPDDAGDEDLIQDIVDNPANYYINVHNADFPAGAIRGQLDAVPLVAFLDGAQEVPGPGDEDGFGAAFFAADGPNDLICYDMAVSNIEPAAAAHIHAGEEGVAGGIVVTLETPDADGQAVGCDAPDAPVDTIQDIIDDPAGYYVNVHNADFPDGAVRGQLETL